MGKGYDKRAKVTRIFLTDYLLLKGLATSAGVSMAEALHTIITKDWAMAHKAKPVAEPVVVATMPTFIARVKSPVALRVRPEPILTTNGHNAGVFVIKPKGGILNA